MFKREDKVEALTDYPEHDGRRIIKGMQGVVLDHNAGAHEDSTLMHVMFDNGTDEYMFKERFKLVKEEKEEMQFDMKGFDLKAAPWFIRVANEQEYNAVREWVKDKGFKFIYSGDWYTGCEGIIYDAEIDGGKVYRLDAEDDINTLHEIKLTFKTVVDSVTLPEVKTEQQKQIEELEKTILLAKQQIETLKNS